MASTTEEVSYTLPGDKALKNASKIALVEDKKIMMDYWMESFKEDAFLGVRENGDKLLIKILDKGRYCTILLENNCTTNSPIFLFLGRSPPFNFLLFLFIYN